VALELELGLRVGVRARVRVKVERAVLDEVEGGTGRERVRARSEC
jgi:hypothetical protein